MFFWTSLHKSVRFVPFQGQFQPKHFIHTHTHAHAAELARDIRHDLLFWISITSLWMLLEYAEYFVGFPNQTKEEKCHFPPIDNMTAIVWKSCASTKSIGRSPSSVTISLSAPFSRRNLKMKRQQTFLCSVVTFGLELLRTRLLVINPPPPTRPCWWTGDDCTTFRHQLITWWGLQPSRWPRPSVFRGFHPKKKKKRHLVSQKPELQCDFLLSWTGQ